VPIRVVVPGERGGGVEEEAGALTLNASADECFDAADDVGALPGPGAGVKGRRLESVSHLSENFARLL